MGIRGFPSSSAGKESACNAGNHGSIPGWGRSPGGGNGNLLQYSCLESPHGQKNLVGYSPWGRKESDTTEQLSTAHSTWGPDRQYYLSFCCCCSVAKLCLTLSGPMNCSTPGLPVPHYILEFTQVHVH